MNIVQTATAVVGLIVAVGGVSWAGLKELKEIEQRADEKYVPLNEWRDFQWSILKGDLRDLRRAIAEAEDEGDHGYAELLRDEYEELLEYICWKYPDDKDCE